MKKKKAKRVTGEKEILKNKVSPNKPMFGIQKDKPMMKMVSPKVRKMAARGK